MHIVSHPVHFDKAGIRMNVYQQVFLRWAVILEHKALALNGHTSLGLKEDAWSPFQVLGCILFEEHLLCSVCRLKILLH